MIFKDFIVSSSIYYKIVSSIYSTRGQSSSEMNIILNLLKDFTFFNCFNLS